MNRNLVTLFYGLVLAGFVNAQEKVEYIKYGDMDSWLVRNIKESLVIGGNTKVLYEIAPSAVWNESKAYVNQGNSPWATSNVMAKVAGATKTNTSVYRETRTGHGYCARLETHEEQCHVLGLFNIRVLAAGSVFLGETLEPITGTDNPMSKLNVGMPFTGHPKALCFDYKVKLSGKPNRIKQTGFSKISEVKGLDMADCVCFLQKRWEDSAGNIYALRVGTMVHRFDKNSDGWVEKAQFTIHYGDITHQDFYQSYMGLLQGEQEKYARNSKGKMVPVKEIGWAKNGENPTHVILQFDSSHGGAYIGSIGNTLWIDNVGFIY